MVPLLALAASVVILLVSASGAAHIDAAGPVRQTVLETSHDNRCFASGLLVGGLLGALGATAIPWWKRRCP
jgi:hypothetical protein